MFAAIGQARSGKDAGIDEEEFRSDLDALVQLASEDTGMIANAKDAGSDDLRNLFIKAYSGS